VDIKKTIERLNAHQANVRFHPITCGVSSRHENMVALVKHECGTQVLVLKCPTCGWEQTHIPDIVRVD
jgi:hypothetical protein